MTGNDIVLYVRSAPVGSSLVGKLGFRRLEFDGQAPKALKLVLEFIPFADFFNTYETHWAWLVGEIWSQRTEPRSFGRLEIEADARPLVAPPGAAEVAWRWRLWPEDIGGIEREFQDVAKSPRSFKVRLTGILQAGAQLVTVAGEGVFQIGVSDWEDHLRSLGYTLPPQLNDLIDPAAMAGGHWAEAGARLETARKHLRAGEPYHALIACLGEFERIVSPCYDAAPWRKLVGDDPDQKASAIAGWLAGHCTFLNRVGHHKSRTDRDSAGDLAEMPLNQWEAELGVATSHVLLTYALRRRSSGDRPR
jgi:hypothetical protein